MNYHPYSLYRQYYDKQTLSFKEGIKEYAAKSCRKMLLEMSGHEKQAFLKLAIFNDFFIYPT